MNPAIFDTNLEFFPSHVRPMAARRLLQGRWGDAFDLADSNQVVSAVLLNVRFMDKKGVAQQLKKALTRTDGSLATSSHFLLRTLLEYQDELQALSDDLPGEEPWTIYRGYDAHWADARHGFWTLSKEVANWYATRSENGRLVKTEMATDEFIFGHDETDEQVVVTALMDDHPVEEIPTFASNFVPLPYTKAALGAEQTLTIANPIFGIFGD